MEKAAWCVHGLQQSRSNTVRHHCRYVVACMSDATVSDYFLRTVPFGDSVDDLTEVVGKYIWDHIATDNVEIELRLGRVVEPEAKERLRWPLVTPTVLDSGAGSHNFDAAVTERTYNLIYQFLNARFQDAKVSPLPPHCMLLLPTLPPATNAFAPSAFPPVSLLHISPFRVLTSL